MHIPYSVFILLQRIPRFTVLHFTVHFAKSELMTSLSGVWLSTNKTKKVCGHKRVTVNTDRLHQRVKSRTPNGASTLLNLCSNYKVIQFWEGI